MSDRNMSAPMVNVRCMVDDVNAAIVFYNTHLGFTLLSSAAPTFADVTGDGLRLVLIGAPRLGWQALRGKSAPVPIGTMSNKHLFFCESATA